MEHFYQNIHGWFNFENIYQEIAGKLKDGDHYVEVGAWKGTSAAYLATEIANSGKKIQFDVVDTWLGSPEHLSGGAWADQDAIDGRLFEVFTENMKPVVGFLKPQRITSSEASLLSVDNSLDFVMLDASHEYEDVKADILAWMPKIKSGGILSGDDYHHTWPGVMQAVQELVPDAQIVDSVTWAYQKE